MNEEHTYPLDKRFKINGTPCAIKGYAKYVIENGMARFVRVKISDWNTVSKRKDADMRLTDNDIKAVQDLVLNELNEDYGLCDYLTSDDANGF